MFKIFDVSKSGYYKWLGYVPEKEEIKHKLKEIIHAKFKNVMGHI